jgi:hypothetical protein
MGLRWKNGTMMNDRAGFDLWLRQGVEQGWVVPVCLMHDDRSVWTADELYGFDVLGEDPCVPRYVVVV